jgi:hypothetical protein
MATAAASVVLGQPTRDESCSTTAFLLIACGAVGIGGWPYRSHPPSCLPVLRKAPGTMQAGVIAYARGVAGGDAETMEGRGLRGRIRFQGVELRSAGGCGQQRRPAGLVSATTPRPATEAEAYRWERSGRFQHLILRVGTPRWS